MCSRGQAVCFRVLPGQAVDGRPQFLDVGCGPVRRSGGARVVLRGRRLGPCRREAFTQDDEFVLRLRPGPVGPLVDGERRLLRGPVDMAVLRAGRRRVLRRAAHRAGHPVGELTGQFRRDAAQPPLP